MGGAGAGLGIVCCALVGGVLLGTLLGAVILRAACSLYNKIAGGENSPSAVPEPEFGRAMGIVFVTTIVQMGVGFVLGLIVGGATMNTENRADARQLFANLVGIPIGFLVMSGMLTAMLPTTFPRAMLVALLHMVIGIAIAAVIIIILLVAFGGAAFLGHH